MTVQASDGNGGTAMQTISVTVTPVNDNNPVFTSFNAANRAGEYDDRDDGDRHGR